MNKKKKNILYSLIAIFTFFFAISKTNAATLNVNISSSSSRVVVGNTVTYTVTVSSSEYLGSLQYNFSYDSSKLTLTSGTLNAAPYYDGTKKSASYSFSFRAKASGTATVKFNIYQAVAWNEKNFSYNSTTSKSTTIITQEQLQASYSKNNYLSSLKVKDYKISPTFNKNTSNYTLTVENDVKSITISGSKEDSTSSVTGLGKHSLKEGTNKIKIVVTAQNGDSRTYTLNVTVKELTPIVVKVDEQEYNVVRKKEELKKPNDIYEDTTIKIDKEEVPAFINKNTNTTLVGLKDKDGVINLYKYKDDNNYELYKEYSFDSLIVTASNGKEIPTGYVKTTIKINDQEIEAYKDKNNSDFYIFSGINIKTGEENIYQYNKKENTLQILNDSIQKLSNDIDKLKEEKRNYLYVIIGLGIFLIITYLVVLISMIRSNNKAKLKRKLEVQKKIEEINRKEELKRIQEEMDKKEEEKLSSTSKKNKKVNKEIEKKSKKDVKIKEDVSNKAKKK